MRIIPVLLTLLLLASAIAPGLATSQDSELILRVAMQDDMKGTNPITVSDVWSWNVLGYLFDNAISINPDTGDVIPYIAVGSANVSGKAESWDDCAIGIFGYSPTSIWQNASKREAIIFYDFENVYWHDGHQMDIRDIMFSMHLAAQVPEWSSSMDPLKAANFTTTGWLEVYKVWESADKLQAALRFQVQEPFADFFKDTLSTFLLPEHIWACKVSGQAADHTKIWCDSGYSPLAWDAWKVAPAQSYENNPPIGSGPFKFEFWTKGQLSRISTFREHFFREDYKYSDYVLDEFGRSQARQPNIDAITYKIFKTAEAAVLALKSDDIDYIAWSVPPSFVQELSNEPGIALSQSPETGFSYLAYNMRKSSFGYNETGVDVGKPLRQAIAHCIDKERIVTRLLLNLGISATGPISPLSKWYNVSVPKYDFNPDKAKRILADAGYKVKMRDGSGLIGSSTDATLQAAAIAAAGNGNWWVNPDGTNIGSKPDGLIEILAPEANYDPIAAQKELMIAEQLRAVGIYAQSIAMDFGSIVDRADNLDFDVYILSWHLSSEPDDFLHAFFHSSQIEVQNYPGYQNTSFDAVIDLARSTGDPEIKRKAIFEAQAAICYDLPYDVLNFKTNIEAYRSDRFVGWVVGDTGSIFNWESVYNIRAPGPWKANAQFVSPPSAVVSNSTTPISIIVKDQDGNPLSGAVVKLNCSAGTLSTETGITNSAGKLVVDFTAPYADPTNIDNVLNGTQAIIQIVAAAYVSPDGIIYDPAPSRLTLVSVFPEGAEFLSVQMSADPDIIDPDISDSGELGFTYVDVYVTNQDGVPVVGSSVTLAVSPAVPLIEPEESTTDTDGKARFKVTATDLPNHDGEEVQYSLTATAIHPTVLTIRGENTCTLMIVDAYVAPPQPHYYDWGVLLAALVFILIPLGVIFIMALIVGIIRYFIWRRRKF